MFCKKPAYTIKALTGIGDIDHPEKVEKYRIIKNYDDFYIEVFYQELERVFSGGMDGNLIGYNKKPAEWHIRIPNSGKLTGGVPVFDGTNAHGELRGEHKRLSFKTQSDAESFIQSRIKGPELIKEIIV